MGEKYGGDEVYGESIYTKRWELLEPMNCLTIEKMLSPFHTDHDQKPVLYLPF
jgi:outer membrane receptor for ferrienterochelin and colicins